MCVGVRNPFGGDSLGSLYRQPGIPPLRGSALEKGTVIAAFSHKSLLKHYL